MDQSPQRKRLYKAWKGNNRFFCGGRLFFGPDAGSLFFTTILIVGPSTTFCSQVLPKIRKLQPLHGLAALSVATILTILDLLFLFLTSCGDPGIVPRNARPPESAETLDTATPSMEWVNGRTPQLRLPRTKEVEVNGIPVRVKYCDTCMLYRPPRTSHCSICNNCVQKFDHHCPWVGQCIGLRNYRCFYLFVLTSTILCIYVFVYSWINIFQQKHKCYKTDPHIWRTMAHEIQSVVVIVYCFLAFWFVGGLSVFHLYLICTNQTTYENFRSRYDKKENPYDRGILRNIKEVLFTKKPPSMNDFRSWVVVDDVEVGEVTPNGGAKADMEIGRAVPEVANMPHPEILQDLESFLVEQRDADLVMTARDAAFLEDRFEGGSASNRKTTLDDNTHNHQYKGLSSIVQDEASS